jgi:hypothetical protein
MPVVGWLSTRNSETDAYVLPAFRRGLCVENACAPTVTPKVRSAALSALRSQLVPDFPLPPQPLIFGRLDIDPLKIGHHFTHKLLSSFRFEIL